MANKSQIKVDIVGDASSAQRAAKETEASLLNLEGTVEKVEGSLGRIETFGSGLAAIAGLAGLTEGFKAVVEEGATAEQNQAQLEARLKSTGSAAGLTAAQLNDLSTALQTTTTYEDDTILSAENLLLTFTSIHQDVFPQAIQAILDMSTALGQDLQSSTIQVGKALQDPIRGLTALQRVGVQFTEQQREQVKAMVEAGDTAGAQKLILAELNKEFGGSAQADANTYAGSMKQLDNEWKNMKEQIGTALLPALQTFNKVLTEGARSTGFHEFMDQAARDIQILLAGLAQGKGVFNLYEELGLTVEKAVFLATDGVLNGINATINGALQGIKSLVIAAANLTHNDQLKQLAEGIQMPTVNFGQDFLKAWYQQIQSNENDIQKSIDQYVAKPAATALKGESPGSDIAPDKVSSYGSALLDSYLNGLQSKGAEIYSTLVSTVQSALTALNPGDAAAVNDQLRAFAPTLAEMAGEIEQTGQVSAGTWAKMQQQLGPLAPEVTAIAVAYQNSAAAAGEYATAQQQVADAQAHLQDVQNQATADLKGYQQAVDAATAVEKAHQQAAQDAAQAVQDKIAADRDEADAQARATQAELDGLNAQLAAIQQVQQAHQAGAQARAGLEAAILAGQKDEYLSQLDLVDAEKQQTQAIADKWEAEIGGARRAKSDNDAEVLKLQREERAKVLQYNKDIDAARENDNKAEVARLTKVRDEYTKVQGHKIDMAQQEAAVANDTFEIQKDKLDKEAQGIKDNDSAQAKADKTAIDNQQTQIKGVQDRQKAEQQAAQERQRTLQAELTAIQRNAREQDKADKDAITAAQKRYDERKTYWDQETTNAQTAVKNAQAVELSMKNTADQAKAVYDWEVKRFQLYKDNGILPGQLPATPPPLAPNVGQPQGPGGEPGSSQSAPVASAGTSDSLARGAASRNILGDQPASGGDIHIHSTVNVNGNASASDAQRIADANAAQVRRIWQEVARGGARQSVTTPRTA